MEKKSELTRVVRNKSDDYIATDWHGDRVLEWRVVEVETGYIPLVHDASVHTT